MELGPSPEFLVFVHGLVDTVAPIVVRFLLTGCAGDPEGEMEVI